MHMNLKCDPEERMMLRDPLKAVIPGWHMNNEHWNTLVLDDSVPRGRYQANDRCLLRTGNR